MLQTSEISHEYYIGRNIIIDDPDMMLSILQNETGIENIDLKDIAEFVESQKATKFYFDAALSGRNPADSKDIAYLWVDTGFVDERGRPLFLSLLNHRGYFSGHFIGTSYYLAGNVMRYHPEFKNRIIENETRFSEKYKRKIADREIPDLMDRYKVIREIKTNAIKANTNSSNAGEETKIKEYWESKPLQITEDISSILLVNNWQSIKGLDRYIKIIGVRIPQLIDMGRTEYFHLNHIKSAVVNTGLIDKFGSYICVVYRKHLSFKLYTPQCIIERKADYVNEGFKESGTESLIPIDFLGDKVFDATLDNFDITPRALAHIIEERKERFPEYAQDMSEIDIADKIKSALNRGLKLHAVDPTYIKPSYSGRDGKIAWIVPLHIRNKITEAPELVLVTNKVGDFYEIKTILPYDDTVRDRLTALSLYGRLW